VSVEKPEGKKPLGSPNVRWENNINCLEAIPLCLLLNKLHLFSLTQHRFILNQTVSVQFESK
jgi:hypothetical protein